MFITLALISSLWHLASGDNWQENVRPKLFAQLTSRDYHSFVGNPQLTDTTAGKTSTSSKVVGSSGGNNNNNNLTRFLNQEFFTIMHLDLHQDILMVGARNILYKLSAEELRLTQTLQWHSLDQDRESCLVKGKSIIECQNYIKVLQQFKVSSGRFRRFTVLLAVL